MTMSDSSIVARWRAKIPLESEYLSSLSRIPLDRLQQLEQDLQIPTRSELEVLAGIAGLRTSDLFKEEWSSPLAPLFFKASAAGRLSDLETRSDWPAIAQFTRSVRDVAELRALLGVPAPTLPRISLAELPAGPTEAGVLLATRARQAFGLGLQPIDSLLVLLQNHAEILAAGADDIGDDVSGVTVGSPHPAILIPLRDWYQRRFAMAHELCHLIADVVDEGATISSGSLQFADDDRAREIRADAFAANFLAPDLGVKTMVANTCPDDPADERNVEAVASNFGVSRIVAVNRLANNFTTAYRRRAQMALRHPNWTRRAPPNDLPIPTPMEVIRELGYKALSGQLISANRLRELIGLRRDQPIPAHSDLAIAPDLLVASIQPQNRARHLAWSYMIGRGHPDVEIDFGTPVDDGWMFTTKVSGGSFDVRVSGSFIATDG